MGKLWAARDPDGIRFFFGNDPPIWDFVNEEWVGEKYCEHNLEELVPKSKEIEGLSISDPPVEIIFAPVSSVVTKKEKSFYEQLAEKLRELWPKGDKDGKYAWRDSVTNISKRLKTLWEVRNLKDYTIEECLAAANKYLSEFENDVHYMQVLKYFILKQREIVDAKGHIKYESTSRFADILEGLSTIESSNDFESLMNENSNFNIV